MASAAARPRFSFGASAALLVLGGESFRGGEKLPGVQRRAALGAGVGAGASRDEGRAAQVAPGGPPPPLPPRSGCTHKGIFGSPFPSQTCRGRKRRRWEQQGGGQAPIPRVEAPPPRFICAPPGGRKPHSPPPTPASSRTWAACHATVGRCRLPSNPQLSRIT